MKYRIEALMPIKGVDGYTWRNVSGDSTNSRNKTIRMASWMKRNDVTKKVRIRRVA